MKFFKKIIDRVTGRPDYDSFTVDPQMAGVDPEDNRRDLPDDIGPDGAVDEQFKSTFAHRLAKSYLDWGDTFVPQVLERMVDIKLCSLIPYFIARRVFGPGGADIVKSRPDILDLFRLEITTTEGHNVIDHSFGASILLPVKYRGYGHPVNSREHIGHLFQVNILSFPGESHILGYRDTAEGSIEIIKGMKPVGNFGRWDLFELDLALSDDTTALFTLAPPFGDRLVEVCHFNPDKGHASIIYRFQRKA